MRWLIGGVHDLDSVMRVTNYYFLEYLSQRIAHGAATAALYLPAPISPLHFAARRADPRFAERRRHWGAAPRPWMPGTAQVTPLTLLPVLRGGGGLLDRASVARASMRLTLPSLAGVLRRAGFDRPDVLVLTNLQYGWLDRMVRPARLVYCCEDDIAGFPHAPRCLLEVERDLIRRADACFATSAHLAGLLRERGAKTVHLARNGVDFDRFAAGGPEPADLAAIPHPRVIYVGMLNSRFRVDWLDRAATALPGHHFVLIGPEATPLDALRGRPNIHLLGPRPSEALPAYYAASDAGIVPFRRSPLTDATCPIKLYEYLAAGLPVIASRWPEMESIAAPATLVDDETAFVAALASQATETPSSIPHPSSCDLRPSSLALAREARLAFARANSWRARFERLEEIVAAIPPRRP